MSTAVPSQRRPSANLPFITRSSAFARTFTIAILLLLLGLSAAVPTAFAASVTYLSRGEWAQIDPNHPLTADENIQRLMEYRMAKLNDRGGYSPLHWRARWRLRGGDLAAGGRIADEYRRKLDVQHSSLSTMAKPFLEGIKAGLPAPYYQLLARQYQRNLTAEHPLDPDEMEKQTSDRSFWHNVKLVENFLLIPAGEEADRGLLNVDRALLLRFLHLRTFFSQVLTLSASGFGIRICSFFLMMESPTSLSKIINDPRVELTREEFNELTDIAGSRGGCGWPFKAMKVLSSHPLFDWNDQTLRQNNRWDYYVFRHRQEPVEQVRY